MYPVEREIDDQWVREENGKNEIARELDFDGRQGRVLLCFARCCCADHPFIPILPPMSSMLSGKNCQPQLWAFWKACRTFLKLHPGEFYQLTNLLFIWNLFGYFKICFNHYKFSFFLFFKDCIYLLLERGREREREGEKHQCVVASWASPTGETRPATQACALTGNQTGNPLACRPALNPLRHTSQGYKFSFVNVLPLSFVHLFNSLWRIYSLILEREERRETSMRERKTSIGCLQ